MRPGRGPCAQFVTHEYVNTRHTFIHTHACARAHTLSFSPTSVIDVRPKIFLFVSIPPCPVPQVAIRATFYFFEKVLLSQLSKTFRKLYDLIFLLILFIYLFQIHSYFLIRDEFFVSFEPTWHAAKGLDT